MKSPLLLLVIVFINFSFSQEEKKFLVGAYFNPEYSFRTISGDETNSMHQLILAARDTLEEADFGYETGVAFEYQIRWFSSIELGLGFSSKSFQSKSVHVVSPTGAPYGYKLGFLYQSFYLTIPLKFRFSFLKKKIRPFASIGISTNIYLGNKNLSRFEYDDGSKEVNRKTQIQKEGGFLPVNIQGLVSVGCDFDFEPGITLRIEPTYRHSLHSITEKEGIQGFFYSLGCSLSVFYRF